MWFFIMSSIHTNKVYKRRKKNFYRFLFVICSILYYSYNNKNDAQRCYFYCLQLFDHLIIWHRVQHNNNPLLASVFTSLSFLRCISSRTHRHWHIPNVSIELLSSSFCDSNLWVLAVCCGKMQCKRISMYLFWMLLQSEPVDTFFFAFIVNVHSSLSSDVNSLLCNKYFIEELSKKCWNAIIYYVF